MDQNTSNPDVSALPEAIREPVRSFCDVLRSELAENVAGISVVGSSLTDDFTPSSDINTVVVLQQRTLAILNTIAALGKPLSRKKLAAPLLMTERYIERSLDVFSVEFLDFQLTHQTVLGPDPFDTLKFEKKDVRLQCEREFKAMLIRLRQGYIASGANRRTVRDILIATAKGLTPILRAMLWLRDKDRPACSEAAIRAAGGTFELDTEAIVIAERWHREQPRISDLQKQEVFEGIYETVDRLSVIVDELEV